VNSTHIYALDLRSLIIFGQNLELLTIVLPEEETKGGKRKRKERMALFAASCCPPHYTAQYTMVFSYHFSIW
jgi:hypothetical protein